MANTTVSMKSIVERFEALPDPRHTRNRRHLLGDVIVLSVCGVIVGCSGPSSIHRWAKAKKDWLEQVLKLPGGIPSRDCIRRILSALQPEAFQRCFQAWIIDGFMSQDQSEGPTIAIDGKSLRRSHDANKGLGPLHLVSAWASEYGLTLGQVATEAKSNEITVIPKLIDQIDVKGAVVTIDAMGCQKDIAAKIVAQKGDYVLAVKDNQPKLHQAIQELFSDDRQNELLRRPHHLYETNDKGHGRSDERHYVLVKIPKDFLLSKEWPSVKAVGMVVRTTVDHEGRESGDVRYFIASRLLSGKRFAQAVRGHWGIENSLHWVLDVTFDEDQSRARERRLADNLSWLRRFAISMLKRHPSKDSIKGKSEIAGWNNDFLMEVLEIQGT
ncbi:MAG: ISAs1 family transposase [Planctomycetota bacterium]|jgi:predicted transposase YbfD/YdcC